MDNTCWLYNSDMSHNSGTLIVALQKRLGIFLNLPPTLILSLLLYSIKWIIIFNNLKINTTGYVYIYFFIGSLLNHSLYSTFAYLISTFSHLILTSQLSATIELQFMATSILCDNQFGIKFSSDFLSHQM